MRFGNVGKGLAGLVVAGAGLLGNVDNAKGTLLSDISSEVSYGDFNSDSVTDTRVTYHVSNELSGGVSPWTDIKSWVLDAGKNYNLDAENVSFDLPSGWNYSVGDIQTTFSANSASDYISDLSSLDFYVTSFGGEDVSSVNSRAYNGLDNNLEEYVVKVITPEPATLSLLGLGGLGVLIGRKRTSE